MAVLKAVRRGQGQGWAQEWPDYWEGWPYSATGVYSNEWCV